MTGDMTNQQLYDKLGDRLTAEIRAVRTDLVKMEVRLRRTIKEGNSINIQHHLETRAMIGDVNQKFDHLREGLSKATTPL